MPDPSSLALTNKLVIFQFFTFINSVCMCVCVHMCTVAFVIFNFGDSILFFQHVDSEAHVGSMGLMASTFPTEPIL